MKRKFFSCLMFSALIGAGMISVTSCADYDEDMKTLTQIVDNNTTATTAIQKQVDGMEAQIKALQDALNAMKSCTCGDVDAKIADQISKALAGLNYATPDQVADDITKALAGLNTGLTEAEVQALIDKYHAAHPDCQCGDIQALIEKYLKDNPGLSEADVEAIVKAYHDAHPSSTLTETDVKSIVETYINQLQHFTKEQIEGMINTAITQALAGYVQKSEVYTKSQVEELIAAAIAQITHPESGLSAADVQKLIDAAIAKITHPESGLSQSEVEKLIADALKTIKPGLTEAEVKALIEAAKCNCPALTTEDVTTIATSVIEKYMKDHPYTLDTAAVESICNSVINNSQVINNIQSAINTLQTTVDKVVEDLQNLKDNVYTKTEVENLINALIAQAIKNCDCDNTALTTEQQAIISNLISEAINNYNAAHPDCNCQYDAAAFQSLVDAVAANTSAIQSIQGDYVTSSQLLQAIEDVKNLIPTIPDLSVYVTVATYNADMVLVNLSIAAADTKAQEALDKANEALSIANDALNSANNALDNANTALTTANANKVLIDNLTTTVSELNALYLSLSQKLDNTARKADTALTHALSNYFEIETLKSLYAELSSKIALIESQGYDDTAILNRLQNLEEQLGSLESQIASLATKEELEAQLQTVQGLVSDAQAAAQNYAYNAAASAASAVLADAKSYTDTKMGELNTKIGELITAYNDADLALQGQIGTINDRLNDIDATLTDLQKQIDKVTGRLDKVENALAHLITGIELQGSVNPAFGYYSLPIGVTSNVLIAYYGENEHDTAFPRSGAQDLVYNDSKNQISAKDWQRLGLVDDDIWEWNGGSVLTSEEGNAGKIYLTINPSSVDFTGTTFKLVNSLGEESPVTLGALQPSTDKLTFGQTRGTSANGFYEAKATVVEENVGKANFGISDRLKNSLEDVVKNKLHADLSNLAQAVYNQFNGVLDAYAVQANWTDELGSHTVTSKYGVAATAIKPLSYNTLYGVSFKLPTVTPLSELNIDLNDYIKVPKFDFTFNGIDVDKFKDKLKVEVHFSDVWVESDGSIWTNVHMTSYVKNGSDVTLSPDKMVEEKFCLVNADGTFNGPIYDFEGGVNPALALDPAQRKAVNAMIALLVEDRAQVWSAQLQDGFQDMLSNKMIDLVTDINGVVTNVSEKLEGTISGKLKDMIDKANGKLNSLLSKSDKFVNQFNKLINTVNDKLLGDGNPNLRLQSQVFYHDASGNLHPMSTAKGIPTIVSGDGEGVELTLSSYTGEILAPSFKKFVAITNVYRDGKDADSDPELMKAVKAANSVERINEVFSGDRYAAVFYPTVKGATYEIVYSSLDFHGYISQRKYYVYVK